MNQKTLRLRRPQAALTVVDIQERLLPAMFEPERVERNAAALCRGAGILRVPVLVTEQYRKGLGATVPAVAQAVPNVAPREKLAFSACGAAGFVEALRAAAASDVILCGIETHVCVCQTCLDLLHEGFRVFVVADAVSSRTPENQRLGLERMREAGAIVVSTEMVLFELLGQAGTPEFKQVQALIK